MCVHVHALSCELADVFFPGMGVISDRLSSTDLIQVQISLALHAFHFPCVYLNLSIIIIPLSLELHSQFEILGCSNLISRLPSFLGATRIKANAYRKRSETGGWTWVRTRLGRIPYRRIGIIGTGTYFQN